MWKEKRKKKKTGTFLADDDDVDLDGDDQRFCRCCCVLLDTMPLADDDDLDGDDQRVCRCCCVLLYAMPLAPPPASDNQSIVCLFTELFFLFWFVCLFFTVGVADTMNSSELGLLMLKLASWGAKETTRSVNHEEEVEIFCRRGVKRSSSFQDLDKAKMAKRVYQVWKGSNVSVSIPRRSLSLSLTYSCLVLCLSFFWGIFLARLLSPLLGF